MWVFQVTDPLTHSVARAYGLAYASTTISQLLSILLEVWRKKKHKPNFLAFVSLLSALLRSFLCSEGKHTMDQCPTDDEIGRLLAQFRAITIQSLSLHAFPTFSAALIGGNGILNRIFLNLFCFLLRLTGWKWKSPSGVIRLSRFLAAFISAWYSLQILNARRPPKSPNASSGDSVWAFSNRLVNSRNASSRAVDAFSGIKSSPTTPKTHKHASRTLDLTLFATVRALETIIITLSRHSRLQRAHASNSEPIRPSRASRGSFPLTTPRSLPDTLVFTISSSLIMWSWFYYPDQLPPAYNHWISSAAQVDRRLINALRSAHQGKFTYGQNTGHQGRILQEMCSDYGWPEDWGDPEKTCPIPCDMVHMGAGPSCHKHAVLRFTKSFKFAMATNTPLQLSLKLVPLFVHRYRSRMRLDRKIVKARLTAALETSARASAFLAAFITLTYYGICLSRTLIGPKLIPSKWVSQQDWDSGICVGTGCALSGCSILIEDPRRRGELAMFVAPKALGTMVDRGYELKYFWRERAAFALSTAVLLTCAQEERGGLIRGWLGKLLKHVLS